MIDGEKTKLRVSDASYQNKKELDGRQQDHLNNEFTHEGKTTKPFSLSIAELLKDVKDNNSVPYINPDGSGNFAVLLNQTAFHGSPHKFDTFDLGAIGTGEGAQVHGWYNQSIRG